MPIIDSSIFVKYLSREEGRKEAEKHLSRPVTLPIALKEIANALRTKTLDGALNPKDAKEMIGKIASMVRLLDRRTSLRTRIRLPLTIESRCTTRSS